MKSSAHIRQAFLDYFAGKGHTLVPSSSLVPASDPTLLFTNAGMVQFKDVFLGRERRDYTRAVTVQRCVRAGGKHNDLENVGYTARHHTFFEMLGNFSFGDYFKRDAIHFAWEFLTQVLGLPPSRLWVTVFNDDDEATRIWLDEVGVSPSSFSRCGEKDNFWAMGETGPCGPCSEIYYDHGPDIPGGPPGSLDAEADRYVEIWNLVFMQYDRDAKGRLHPLPKPSVDTGMGLERLAAVLQGVHSNYEIDLFQHLIQASARIMGVADLSHKGLRVIADHIRSAAFLIADGVLPSNEGRGYVLRRIIRRAVRHGYQLGLQEPFFHELAGPLAIEMGDAHPVLIQTQATVERVLKLEEGRFAETLSHGMGLLEQAIRDLPECGIIPGEVLFKLYDTYGFPIDLTADVARERGLEVDLAAFDVEMNQQRERARAASQFGVDHGLVLSLDRETRFTGYERLVEPDLLIMGLYREGQSVDRLEAGEEGCVVLNRTPFYAESGGQVGDCGWLRSARGTFEVLDTRKQGAGVILHRGVAHGEWVVGNTVSAEVDVGLRQATALNHSATHLLHAALRQLLGSHVLQKGSQVAPNRLRFDFAHFEPLSSEQLLAVERLVNQKIRDNSPVETRIMSLEEAKASGALALFGEKYGDRVRVLRMGDFSTELCGGTHVRALGDIGCFKMVMESGVAAGVRRIEAMTGEGAMHWVEEGEAVLRLIGERLRGGRNDLGTKVTQLLEHNRQLERALDQLKSQLAQSAGADLASRAVPVAGVHVLAAQLPNADTKILRETLDRLRDQLGSAVILLATTADGKVSLVVGATQDVSGRCPAGELARLAAEKVGGKGGGRPEMAQAGGSRVEGLAEALALVLPWVRERIGGS
ncbi:MAG: alanine--tRNA ligase [Pseudomonadota bacterium]